MLVLYLESTKHIQDTSLSFAYLCELHMLFIIPDMQTEMTDVQVV